MLQVAPMRALLRAQSARDMGEVDTTALESASLPLTVRLDDHPPINGYTPLSGKGLQALPVDEQVWFAVRELDDKTRAIGAVG